MSKPRETASLHIEGEAGAVAANPKAKAKAKAKATAGVCLETKATDAQCVDEAVGNHWREYALPAMARNLRKFRFAPHCTTFYFRDDELEHTGSLNEPYDPGLCQIRNRTRTYRRNLPDDELFPGSEELRLAQVFAANRAKTLRKTVEKDMAKDNVTFEC